VASAPPVRIRGEEAVADENKEMREDSTPAASEVEVPEAAEVPADDDRSQEESAAEAAPLGGDDLFAFDDAGEETDAPDVPDVPGADVPDVQDSTADDTADEVAEEVAAPTPEEILEAEKRAKGMRWFVIHANTGHEDKVRRNIEMAIKANSLEELFGEILVATQDVTEMRNGKRTTSKRKFFPSYVLVEMVMTKETQHFINSIPGVTRFIGGTQLRPQPISSEEVDRILDRTNKAEEAGSVLEIPYQVGDSVQVIDGPFSDWVGAINEINQDKGKLKVMISIFGSETPVELDFLQVKEV